MGRAFVEGLLEMGTSVEVALKHHLLYNHYPPVHSTFIPACKEAIELGNCGEWDKKIELPNGKIRTVSQIVEGLHLDSFLRSEEW